MTVSASDLPVELWEQIISKLDHDLHRHLHLPSLSLVCKHLCSITSRFNRSLRIFGPTTYLFSSLLRRFSNLNHISLSGFSGDPVPVLHQIAQFKFPLETLDLSKLDRLPVDALKQFPASILSGVKSFKICYLSEGFDDTDLEAIAALFPNLEELDLSRHSYSYHRRFCDDDDDDDDYNGMNYDESNYYGKPLINATDDGISSLASKLKGSLRRIDLKGNSWVSDESLISLSEKCPNLEEMVVKGCRKVTPRGIALALEASKNLKTIGFHRMELEPNQIRMPLSRAQNLSNIVFSNTAVSDSLLKVIAEANLPLTSFSLINCGEDGDMYRYGYMANPERLTFAGLSSFLKCYDSLHHLVLVGVYFLSDELMGIIANSLTMLRSVKLRGHDIYRELNLSDRTMFTLIQQCPLLETLEMTHFSKIVGNEASATLGVSNAEIRTLDLSHNSNLSDQCLEKIASACPNLVTLKLIGCVEISMEGVGRVLRDCHSLKHLDIGQCSGVTSLGRDKRKLNLESLVASGSGLNDQALIDIPEKCPLLMLLNVGACQHISSHGVKRVVDKCTQLKEINLSHCPNLSMSILPWLVFCKQTLRKITPPVSLDITDYNLYLRKGCYMDGCENFYPRDD